MDFGLELPIWHPQDLETHQFPGQYVSKNNSTRRVRAGKEWERAGKPLIFFGGCNFRKGKYLRFCRESNSQCGGQGFDPPLLHQKESKYLAAGFLFPVLTPRDRHKFSNACCFRSCVPCKYLFVILMSL